jgi:hypothetical protein
MAVWAYECRGGDEGATVWFVSRAAIDEMPPGVREVCVKVGSQWLPAVVDRTQPIAVDGMLVREVVASDAG